MLQKQNEGYNLGLGSGSSNVYDDSKLSMGRVLIASCLLASLISASIGLWAMKFGEDSNMQTVFVNSLRETYPDVEFTWTPLEIEKKLYIDRGYNLSWLDSKVMDGLRETLGKAFPPLELLIIRLYGVFSHFIEFLTLVAIAFSLGRISYYDKIAQNKPISSTIYFRSVRFVLFSIICTWIWVIFPYGVKLPGIGEIPILYDLSDFSLGIVWVSSPEIGFWISCCLIWIGVHQAASNLKRLA